MPTNQTCDILVACFCSIQIQWQAYVHVVVTSPFKTHTWPVHLVEWQLSVGMRDITTIQKTVPPFLIDEAKKILLSREVHRVRHTQIYLLGHAAIDTDGRQVRPREVHDHLHEVTVLL